MSNKPLLWCRNADDVFVLWRNEDIFDDFLSEVDSLGPSIRFTAEWELTERFLDTMTYSLRNASPLQAVVFSIFLRAS